MLTRKFLISKSQQTLQRYFNISRHFVYIHLKSLILLLITTKPIYQVKGAATLNVTSIFRIEYSQMSFKFRKHRCTYISVFRCPK